MVRVHDEVVHIENHVEVLEDSKEYRVDIFRKVVAAKGRSAIVAPMAKDTEARMLRTHTAVGADIAACLLQAAGEIVCLFVALVR